MTQFTNKLNNNRNFSTRLLALINEIKCDYSSCYEKSDYMSDYIDNLQDALCDYLNNYFDHDNFDLAKEYERIRNLSSEMTERQYNECFTDFYDNLFNYYFEMFAMEGNCDFTEFALKYAPEFGYDDPDDIGSDEIAEIIEQIYNNPDHPEYKAVRDDMAEYFNEIYLGGDGDYFDDYDKASWAEEILYAYCANILAEEQ